ncbi:hypothetical protein K505DRAFT_323498 [Melanomma pulvis-pyrius CBS 109.77]|uniref:Nuclear membrane fusion protein Kar5 n=1 Tax=Melanomma pulvis-pyrius CBS 109.77 TaxID=1314802 RepID=A0A6A6XIB6_9PLEO|nr:hypothetical protein K505DRAFT_323498 [Melanomma pulvis-pyrius CBS 109.77]
MKQHQVLSQALEIIHSMESAPTCNRLAALNLINDCKALDQNPDNVKSDSELILDEVKSEFAARLAVCELLGAKAVVPRECVILIPSPQACVKGRFHSFFSRKKNDNPDGEYCYPGATNVQFERCLKGLESRPQSWTSYSNARQNAVVMCHASRDGIERERDLAIYKSLTEVVERMASTLSHSMQDMQTWVTKQMKFAEQVRMSQDKALQDMHASREMTLTTFDTVTSTFQSFTGVIKQAAEALKQGLDETLHKSKANIEEAREDLQSLYKELAEMSAQHSIARNDQLQKNHEMALTSLQTNHETAVYSLNALSSSISTLQDQVDVSSGTIDNLNRGLSNLNKTVESLGSATENLRSAIDSTTESIQMIATLGGMAANPRLWATIAVCIFGIWNANRKIAGYFMAACGFAGFLYVLGIDELFRVTLERATYPLVSQLRFFTSFLTTQSPSSLVLPGVAIICLLSVIIWSLVDSTYLYEYRDDQGGEGVLPRIEAPRYPAAPLPRKRHVLNPFTTLWSNV